MESKIISIDHARPERWTIGVGLAGDNSICCFYSERTQSWVGMVYVDSMSRLLEALDKAKQVMRTARRQNMRVEVAV